MIRTVLVSSVVLIGLAGGAVALADPGPGEAPGTPTPMQPWGPGMGPGMGPMPFFGPHLVCISPEASLAGGIAFSEKRLGITDAQRPAWNKLADTLRAAEPALKTMCDTVKAHQAEDKPVSAPDRLATAQKLMALGAEQLGHIQPALADLYAQLTPEQKTLVDQIANPPRFRMGQPGQPGPHDGRVRDWVKRHMERQQPRAE
jgi:hypothetical protein